MLSRIVALLMLTTPAMATPNWPPNGVCLRSPDIAQTSRPDDSTMLFQMRDHSVWRNTLLARCYGLNHPEESFTYQPTSAGTDELCSGQVAIRLNISQTICQLGNFTRIR